MKVDSPKSECPVILLGAARSGTKMLRSILGCHSSLSVVPYDINYIWTMGNFGLGHDELQPADLSSETRQFIVDFIEKFNSVGPEGRVVEKTVSNTLRVPFVNSVFPEAQYVVIVRDGFDVAASSREQWSSRSSGNSILTKLKTFPLKHAWGYGVRYVKNLLGGLLPWNSAVRSWGPRFKGMDDYVNSHELIETCATQWVRCVEGTRMGLSNIAPGKVHAITYENLVRDPFGQTEGILAFLGLNMEPKVEDFCRNHVSGRNIGKWRDQIDQNDFDKIKDIVNPQMEKAKFESSG